MYGSNFCNTTRKPRLFRSIPRAAALVPLPMDDTTPPVTKTYLVSLIYTPREEPKGRPNLLYESGKRTGRGGAGSSLPANVSASAPAWTFIIRRLAPD